MVFNFFKTRLTAVNNLFMGHYVDPKVFYTVLFNRVSTITFIGELDTSKAFHFILAMNGSQVKAIYQHNYFDHDKADFFFNNTLFVLNNKRMIELGNNYCQVLHTKDQNSWGQTVIKELSVFHATNETNRLIGFARNSTTN